MKPQNHQRRQFVSINSVQHLKKLPKTLVSFEETQILREINFAKLHLDFDVFNETKSISRKDPN